LLVFLFGFFNEVIIAPFIQPSRHAAATPLIVSSSSIAPTATPEVIIPKINVEIPTDFSQTTTDESQIENALENGVVHYPTTVKPGEQGNAAFFGHSSNNIFNKGKYKFAFVLLHTLQNGDTFYLTYNGKVYVYKVISRTIVDPSEVGVLGPVPGQTATATLITCDPPGTSLHRLVVVGQQISPDPASNVAATTPTTKQAASFLPGNGPTLFGRFLRSTIGKIISVVVILVAFIAVIRWINKPVRQARAGKI
jgi:LPXTG-site transpeptidase (sortase) family protein